MANKKSRFYNIVKWSTWCWAIFGTTVIIYAYTLLWDFKEYAESYNDINAVHLTWAKPEIKQLESWRIVVDYCLGEHCGRMEGSDIFQTKTSCAYTRQSIVEEMIDIEGVFAYRCEQMTKI
tara:strand:+ start:778 stop:1140 length:363 start_codon:yes stop_codon:yes gene_type:complete